MAGPVAGSWRWLVSWGKKVEYRCHQGSRLTMAGSLAGGWRWMAGPLQKKAENDWSHGRRLKMASHLIGR
jgi:hypothetical protein